VSKVRVSALAKEVGVTSKVLLERLNGMGEYVKTASSTVEAPVVRRYKEKFPPESAATSAPAAKTAPAAKSAPAPQAPSRPAPGPQPPAQQTPTPPATAPGAPPPPPPPPSVRTDGACSACPGPRYLRTDSRAASGVPAGGSGGPRGQPLRRVCTTPRCTSGCAAPGQQPVRVQPGNATGPSRRPAAPGQQPLRTPAGHATSARRPRRPRTASGRSATGWPATQPRHDAGPGRGPAPG
jgi:translation initiation factor IF-2